jgi:CubicO group peptidase (beta-lactamase class C family)
MKRDSGARNRLRQLLLAAVVLAVTVPLQAQQLQSRDRRSLPTAIDSIVASYLADGRAAGMSVAVVKGRDTLALKGYGFADLEFDVPTPDRAVYEIGSVTKQFTAAAVLLLQERGKLSLDDPITKYLPDYPTKGHTISLRRLLDHTSGIKGYTEVPEFGTFMMRQEPRDSLVAMFASKPFDFAPGEAQIYNNSAYFLLGLIIEKTSGMSYADFVKKNLFEPAAMADSRYCSERAVIKRRANGYEMTRDGLQRAGYLNHLWPYAAGSLCSTVGDLVAWNRAIHGGRILSPASYQELITPGTLNDGTRLRYAKGLGLSSVAGHRVISHGGGINGFLSAASYFPDSNAIIVVLTNTAGPVSPDAVLASIAETVLGKVPPPTSAAFNGDLKRFAGTYGGVGRGREMRLTIASDSGSLTIADARPGAPVRKARYAGGTTFVLGETRYTFVGGGSAPMKLRVEGISTVTTLMPR